jgi:toxin ParE1/3/4
MRYVLSPRAQTDIEAVWDYTVGQWGVDQAEEYLRKIKTAIEAIAGDFRLGRTCFEIRAGYFKYPASSHMIFYRKQEGYVDIVRILHERMDFDRYL